MSTLSDPLLPLAARAEKLTTEEVWEVFNALREIKRRHLNPVERTQFNALEQRLGRAVEIALFETRDNSGPMLMARLPARTAVPGAVWRREVARQFLLELRKQKVEQI